MTCYHVRRVGCLLHAVFSAAFPFPQLYCRCRATERAQRLRSTAANFSKNIPFRANQKASKYGPAQALERSTERLRQQCIVAGVCIVAASWSTERWLESRRKQERQARACVYECLVLRVLVAVKQTLAGFLLHPLRRTHQASLLLISFPTLLTNALKA